MTTPGLSLQEYTKNIMALDLDDVVPSNRHVARRKNPANVDESKSNVTFDFSGTPQKKPIINQAGLPKVLRLALEGGKEYPYPSKIGAEKWEQITQAFAAPKDNLELVKKVLSANLTKGQKAAFQHMTAFVLDKGPHRFFSLQGFAGTGKTHVLRRLVIFCDLVGIPWILTAPTNKATKVLTSSIPGVEKSKCKTIYSALKLTMSTDEDQQVLVDTTMDNYASLDIAAGTLVCIDEASMLNRMVTTKVKQCAQDLGLRVMFIGDPDQLRPVGEEHSTAWDLSNIETRVDNSHENLVRHVKLTEVKRFENSLLDLSVVLRKAVGKSALPRGGTTEVFCPVANEISVCTDKANFEELILRIKDVQVFRDLKVIGWRNRTVEHYNDLIRKNLGFTNEFNVGDILMLAQPKLQKVNYRRSIIVANIDEEVEVQTIAQKSMKPQSMFFPNLPTIEYWELTTQTTDFQDKPTQLVLNMPLAEDHGLEDALQSMAVAAKQAKQRGYSDKANSRRLFEEAKQRWKEYWALREEFTLVRFAYAITAHRAQGSSIDKIFVDVRDVLANPDPTEKLQCLYVACTRARTHLTVLI